MSVTHICQGVLSREEGLETNVENSHLKLSQRVGKPPSFGIVLPYRLVEIYQEASSPECKGRQ